MENLRVAVSGAAGRMGRAVVRLLLEEEGCELVSAVEAQGHSALGADAGQLAGAARIGVPLTAHIQGQPHVLIDFSTPDASVERALECARTGTAVVVGTTGLSTTQMQRMHSEVASRVPLLIASNMSLGVNILFALAGQAARALGREWNVEVVEAHHSRKKDAPSGTALRLAEAICDALGWATSDVLCCGREGAVGERPFKEVGVHAVRGGDIVGDHTVLFAGQGERIELVHRATSRDIFARGAIRAARFMAHKPPGLYSMSDVLS